MPEPMASPFAPFAHFDDPSQQPQPPLRQAITAAHRLPEPACVAALLAAARMPPAQAGAVQDLARRLTDGLRQRPTALGRDGLVQGLMREFSLSSQEGVALMCLAEALLRVPDAATRDTLIRDKIGAGDWQGHLGRSPSLFVNAATWGLLITGKLVGTHSDTGLAGALMQALHRCGEPLVRQAMDRAMRLMGDQFVAGETIAQALRQARVRTQAGFRHSYDMLGEAALTDADAHRYLGAYEAAIHAIGQDAQGLGIYQGPGISIKLSALHPRYQRSQHARVMAELYPRLLRLTQLARRYDIGLNIDAEESERLDPSLDLLERLCAEPALAGWHGVGFVVQAYQKRCAAVLDHLIDLARRTQRRLMVRLVKGAYWDSEIKRAQLDGLSDYPVFTRKAHTDVSYLANARKLLAAPDAIYPQFATHNAHTLAAVYHAAEPARYVPGQYEFQCLHGMGESLYERVVAPLAEDGLARPCRIYAPVGSHETLLAYLVRRLLENGANSSFVNRIADPATPIEALIADPVAQVEQAAVTAGGLGLPHPRIALPRQLYGDARTNSRGLDLSNEAVLRALSASLQDSATQTRQACPLVNGQARSGDPALPVRNPADPGDVVGTVAQATAPDLQDALSAAAQTDHAWSRGAAAARATVLERAADSMEAQTPHLTGLLMREAGKTCANAVAEVREAVDFLRYYAAQARAELHVGLHTPLGPVVCISPWNFPLAIFTGQVAAALAAGNTVLAKPAEQTPLVAHAAAWLLLDAGVPPHALHVLPGLGSEVGAALVADPRIRAVLFTGSTEVARRLQRQLAGRLDERGQPLTLIAETGGLNTMIVDSSALLEQVVGDVISSAFDSAGQRCSALRLLCVQEDVADRALAMLLGAMRELRLGRPDQLATDIGPVIDAEARKRIEAHIAAQRAAGRPVHQPRLLDPDLAGHFVPPTVVELDRVGELREEIFGPVLHWVRYRQGELPALLTQINASGYGLTLGLHTRIDETVDFVTRHARVGNQYVNRNMVGAVVGVQPFGGEGLSGTGPKAGGPLYLHRLVRPARPVRGTRAGLVGVGPMGIDPMGARVLPPALPPSPAALATLLGWLRAQGAVADLIAAGEALAEASRVGTRFELAGPTGERDTYQWEPRGTLLCLAETEADLLFLLTVALASGNAVAWLSNALTQGLHTRLPAPLRPRVNLHADEQAGPLHAALLLGDAAAAIDWSQRLALRPGPIVALLVAEPGCRRPEAFALERLYAERSVSINTAAAGGNASLMTLG